eukprot:7013251-Prymnesium_polylepis.1
MGADAVRAGSSGVPAPVQLPLVLSAVGLRERAAPYTEMLSIHVRSSLTADASAAVRASIDKVARTELLEVALTVVAQTSFVMWARVAPPERCVPSSEAAALELSSTTVSVQRSVPFTACDIDGIPVDHRLPSPTDARAFSASLNASAHHPLVSQSSATTRVEYTSGGVYDLLLLVPTHDAFTVQLKLAEEAVGTLVGNATYPNDRTPLGGGDCGCRPGFKPESSGGSTGSARHRASHAQSTRSSRSLGRMSACCAHQDTTSRRQARPLACRAATAPSSTPPR